MCECRICVRHQKIEAAIATRDVDALIAFIHELDSELECAETDLCRANGIIDGTWDAADSIIQMKRNAVILDKLRSERVARQNKPKEST